MKDYFKDKKIEKLKAKIEELKKENAELKEQIKAIDLMREQGYQQAKLLIAELSKIKVLYEKSIESANFAKKSFLKERDRLKEDRRKFMKESR